jgi:hypothetical protein
MFSLYLNIISIDQKVMCSIQLQSFWIFLALPNSIFESKVEEQW